MLAACGSGGETTTTSAVPGTTTPVPSTTTPVPGTVLPDGSDVVAEFETPDGVAYKIYLAGEVARDAWEAFEAGERVGIPLGRINPGDGGVNTGHDWHITEVEFAEMATEVCDGTASYIDGLGYAEFVNQHGEYFCPWGAELVSVHPAG